MLRKTRRIDAAAIPKIGFRSERVRKMEIAAADQVGSSSRVVWQMGWLTCVKTLGFQKAVIDGGYILSDIIEVNDD